MMRNAFALAFLCTCVLGASELNAQGSDDKKLSKKELALRAKATVGEDSARAIALKVVPGATVKTAELEEEKGKLIWSFDLKVAGKRGIEEVNIDAKTGKVLAHEHESDAAEAKEAKDEAKAAAKTKTPPKPNP
jgi:hypothetical protein